MLDKMNFRFSCQPGCTACCRQRGYVYFSEADIERAAVFLEMSPAIFERRYIYRTAHLRRLRKPRHSQCPFLLQDGCRIHPAKPTQCRTYPFWPELIEDSGAWKSAADCCPGIGKGPAVRHKHALEISREMMAAYPSMYKEIKARNGAGSR